MSTGSPLLPPRRGRGPDASSDLVARREAAAAMGAGDPSLPESVTLHESELGGIACIECVPTDPTATMLYLHGGGYRMGSPRGWAELAGRLAAAASARVVVADYGLAPEAPFPGALHDAAAVLAALDLPPGHRLLFAGDSAGGGLAVALAVACRDGGAPLPDGLVLLSPWVDLTVASESYASNAERDQMFSAASAGDAAAAYLQGHDARDALASPLFADLRGMPPTSIFVGSSEVLLDDACALSHRLATADVAVELHVVPEVPHVWPLMLPDHEATADALADITRFVARRRT